MSDSNAGGFVVVGLLLMLIGARRETILDGVLMLAGLGLLAFGGTYKG